MHPRRLPLIAYFVLGLAALVPPATLACTVTMAGMAYPNIQAAVNAASMIATISVDGATGTCNENVLIPNVTLRLILAGANGAAIQGAASSPTLDVRVKGILIQGLTISGGEGILIDSMAFGVVTNSTIQNNPGAGIKVTELAGARIGANLEEDGGAVAPNTIANNGGDGILVTSKATAQIFHNTISGNAGNGINVGASASASTAGNLINANQQSGIAGSGRSFLNLGAAEAIAFPDTTTANNGQYGTSCLGGAAIAGYINSQSALTGGLSQFGPGTNSYDASCPYPPSILASATAPQTVADYAFTGPYPARAHITYVTTQGTVRTVYAFSGQVIVLAQTATSAATITGLVQSHGGTVLAQLGELGWYLVQVAPGTEANFIAAVLKSSILVAADPNLVVVNTQATTGANFTSAISLLGPVAGSLGSAAVAGTDANVYVVDGAEQSMGAGCPTHGVGTRYIAAQGITNSGYVGAGIDVSNPGASAYAGDLMHYGLRDALSDAARTGKRSVINLSMGGAPFTADMPPVPLTASEYQGQPIPLPGEHRPHGQSIAGRSIGQSRSSYFLWEWPGGF